MIEQGKNRTEQSWLKIVLLTISFMAILGAVKKPAFASTVSQAKANPSQHNEWRAWQKVGQARLSIFWFDIYDSVLYSPSGQVANWPQITHQPTALSITYLRDISATDFINATEEQWQKLGFSQAQITPWISKLEGIFPNVAEGDSLTYVSHNQRGEFWFASNSASNLIGEIDDMELNQAFLAIWLSPSTSYPKLRAQLLGETR